jgi:hypothetical protein
MQTSSAKSAVRKKTPVFTISSPFSEVVQNKAKNKAGFFSRFNPARWFSEFKNIKITLEEFDNKKSEQG